MLPWKRFVGPVSAVTLLTAGAFAAGSDVMPFSHASRTTSPNVVLDEAPAVDDDASVAPADEVAEDTTTTTTTTTDSETPDTDAPESDTPDTDTDTADADDDADVTPPDVIVDVAPAPAPADAEDAPAAEPAEEDAPAVCAAADEAECGPADAEAAAPTFESKVARCQAWWNRLADRLDDRGRERWAARARRVAERCEAIVTRWQERHDKKVKGDHNCDGHPDNGWHNKERPVCPEPPARVDRPDRPGKPDRGDRPETAPGQLRKNR